jgi:hypothetical protein
MSLAELAARVALASENDEDRQSGSSRASQALSNAANDGSVASVVGQALREEREPTTEHAASEDHGRNPAQALSTAAQVADADKAVTHQVEATQGHLDGNVIGATQASQSESEIDVGLTETQSIDVDSEHASDASGSVKADQSSDNFTEEESAQIALKVPDPIQDTKLSTETSTEVGKLDSSVIVENLPTSVAAEADDNPAVTRQSQEVKSIAAADSIPNMERSEPSAEKGG